MAVWDVRAAERSFIVGTTISLAPVSRMQLSQGVRPPRMMTSPFMPVVSGNW